MTEALVPDSFFSHPPWLVHRSLRRGLHSFAACGRARAGGAIRRLRPAVRSGVCTRVSVRMQLLSLV